MEEWKALDGFDSLEISNKGRVRRKKRTIIKSNGASAEYPTRILRLRWHKKGKVKFTNSIDLEGKNRTIYIPIAVAKLFVDNDDPDNKTKVIHKDNNPRNNNYENLQWVTPSEMMKFHIKVGNKDPKKIWRTRKKRYGNGFKDTSNLGRPRKVKS